MRALIIKEADLQNLRTSLCDRAEMRPAIQRAVEDECAKDPEVSYHLDANDVTDAVLVAVERRIRLRIADWIAEVSK